MKNIMKLSAAIGLTALFFASAATAKVPQEGDVYHYYGRGGACLEDTWEISDEGADFTPAGGWGPCPIANHPHKGKHAKKINKKNETH